jgi:hypothetical protein
MSTEPFPDKAKSIRCLINIQQMPITRFELSSDRPGYKSARARRAVLEKIAGKANSDGTGSFVSDSFLEVKTGFTQRHILGLRKELKVLGLLDWTDHRGQRSNKEWGSNRYLCAPTGELWPRRHTIKRLTTEVSEPKVQNSNSSNPEVSKLNTELSDLNPEVSSLNPELASSDYRPIDRPENRKRVREEKIIPLSLSKEEAAVRTDQLMTILSDQTDKRAVVGLKEKEIIAREIQRLNVTLPELQAVIPEGVSNWDDFICRSAGSKVAGSIAGWILDHRQQIEKTFKNAAIAEEAVAHLQAKAAQEEAADAIREADETMLLDHEARVFGLSATA